jgi:hypothetical protein
MRYEHSSKYTPTSPRCPSCARIMPLARASRFEDLYIDYIFECRACGVSQIDAVQIEAEPVGPSLGNPLLSTYEARRIAANIAKPPELLRRA